MKKSKILKKKSKILKPIFSRSHSERGSLAIKCRKCNVDVKTIASIIKQILLIIDEIVFYIHLEFPTFKSSKLCTQIPDP